MENIIEKVKSRIEVLSKKYPNVTSLNNLKMEVVQRPGSSMYIDGLTLFIESEFIESHSDAEIDWVLLFTEKIISIKPNVVEEAKKIKQDQMHIYFVAGNYYINNIIKNYNDNDLKMIEGSFYNVEYKDKSIDEIYEIINSNDMFKPSSIQLNDSLLEIKEDL